MKAEVKSFRDLLVWQKGMDLVVEVYRVAKLLPQTELYGLTNQIHRSAVSIPANIAEGHGRDHLGDYLHHLSIASGSVAELETHLLIAQRVSLLKANNLEPALTLISEVSRMLAGLTKSLKARSIERD